MSKSKFVPSLAPEVGKCYFVRSVTDYWVGRCVAVGPHKIILTDFAWISQTGRLADFLRDGRADGMEIEPAPSGMNIGVEGAWIDWPHPLLREQV